MKKRLILIVGLGAGLIFLGLILGFQRNRSLENIPKETTWWGIQSIDTVKYSRDLAREKAKDSAFDQEIDKQISLIASTGVTHVAIGTPYDVEFIPFMKRWVAAARRQGLNVWFRGNFAGWERWFGYQKITREEHLDKTREFILSNGELFENGDVFSPCTECENGGPGDPRITRDFEGHQKFLIDEYKVLNEAFRRVGKNIRTNFPMNGDVAKAIMDKETTKALGGIVVIDHYVSTPEKLASDIKEISQRSGGKIILGEFGAPILDLHGNLTSEEQASWIEDSLVKLSEIPEFIGINYWVSFGGSTRLWENDFSQRLAVDVIEKYFKPKVLSGRVINETGKSVGLAKIILGEKYVIADKNGFFNIPYITEGQALEIEASGYKKEFISLDDNGDKIIVLKKESPDIFYKFQKYLYSIVSSFTP